MRWDSTLRESLGFRTESANAALLSNVNADDADRAFTPGLMSARLDLFTEFSAAHGTFGVDISAQGWYDPVYLQPTADRSAATFNPVSVPADRHPAAVRRLMGEDGELLNAYARDEFSLLDMPVSVRLGRQTLLWGESLFFAGNGIAAGQAPVDAIKALSAPLAQARELYLPVAQGVVRIELRPGLALEAYDQFEWRRDRLPGVTSYFSTSDILDQGGERVLLPAGYALYRTADAVPHGIGQFGIALRLQNDAADYGLYALRYDAKLPQPVFDYAAGTYRLVFPTGIDIVGASASSYVGDSNVAGEISWRQHMPLVAEAAFLPSAYGGAASIYAPVYAAPYLPAGAVFPAQAPGDAPYPRGTSGVPTGDTWHAQASVVSQFAPSRWWNAASLQAELACNDLLSITGGRGYVLPGRTHFAASAQAVLTPTYFHVLPGLDINVPVGIGYTALGRSSVDAGQNAGTGDVTVGMSATYRAVWQAAIAMTHFIGGPHVQQLADRDFVTLSVTVSF